MTGRGTPPEAGVLDGGSADGGFLVVDDPAGSTTIVLRGEIDAALAGHLGDLRVRATAAGHAVTVDLSKVTFMDSSGAAFLVHLHRSCAPQPITLLGPSVAVRYLLEVTQLSRIFRVEDG